MSSFALRNDHTTRSSVASASTLPDRVSNSVSAVSASGTGQRTIAGMGVVRSSVTSAAAHFARAMAGLAVSIDLLAPAARTKNVPVSSFGPEPLRT